MLKQKLTTLCNFFLPAKKAAHSVEGSSGIPREIKPDNKTTRIIYRHKTGSRAVTGKITAAKDYWWIN